MLLLSDTLQVVMHRIVHLIPKVGQIVVPTRKRRDRSKSRDHPIWHETSVICSTIVKRFKAVVVVLSLLKKVLLLKSLQAWSLSAERPVMS